MDIEFVWPWAFAALPLPLLVAWLLPRAPEHASAALRMPFYAALQAAVGDSHSGRSRLRLLLAVLSWLLLVLAASRPQFLGEPVQ